MSPTASDPSRPSTQKRPIVLSEFDEVGMKMVTLRKGGVGDED